jgi:hypothetical protein
MRFRVFKESTYHIKIDYIKEHFDEITVKFRI